MQIINGFEGVSQISIPYIIDHFINQAAINFLVYGSHKQGTFSQLKKLKKNKNWPSQLISLSIIISYVQICSELDALLSYCKLAICNIRVSMC